MEEGIRWFDILVERGVATLERPVAPRCLKLRCVSFVSTQLLRQSTSPDSLQGFQLAAGKVADPSHHAVTKEAFWWFVKDKTDYNRLMCSITIIPWQYRDNPWHLSLFLERCYPVPLMQVFNFLCSIEVGPSGLTMPWRKKRTLSNSGNIPLAASIKWVYMYCTPELNSVTHPWHILIFLCQAWQSFAAVQHKWQCGWQDEGYMTRGNTRRSCMDCTGQTWNSLRKYGTNSKHDGNISQFQSVLSYVVPPIVHHRSSSFTEWSCQK